jgi:DNA-binding response OmpR family regulator
LASRLDVVVIEDNDFLRCATVEMIQAAGHDCAGYFCAEDMDQTMPMCRADIFVVDINLPGEDGLRLAERLRRGHPHAGIILFTARTTTADRVKGYGMGADIYMVKPVEPAELCAAIEALGRRSRPAAIANLRFCVDTRLLVGPMGEVKLTASEAILLSHFACAPSRFLEHWQVMSHLFRQEEFNRASLDARMSYLRKKLVEAGAEPPAIQVVRKQGYRLLPSIALSARAPHG